MTEGPIDAARAGLQRAIADRIFPGAVAEVGDCRNIRWREAFGSLTFDTPRVRVDDRTIFDLASLAKPLATTSVVMQLVEDSRLKLGDPVRSFFGEWRGADREPATVQDLLEHAAGLSARLLDAPPDGRREFEHDICALPLECLPRTRALYSDLGFILLGFLVADRDQMSLATQFERIARRVTSDVLVFSVPPELRTRAAPTLPLADDARRGRVLVGEVHDNYAAALGGVAGHAGLFGTATAVGDFARTVLRAARGDPTTPPPLSPALVALATRKSSVPHSSRALGWDTMRPTSSCGAHMYSAAFGHVGFTGTSLWIDPVLNRYFVLLTNRACDGGTSEEMQDVRRAFHDAVVRL